MHVVVFSESAFYVGSLLYPSAAAILHNLEVTAVLAPIHQESIAPAISLVLYCWTP